MAVAHRNSHILLISNNLDHADSAKSKVCSCCDSGNNDQRDNNVANLAATSEVACLAKIYGDGVLFLGEGLCKSVEPFYIVSDNVTTLAYKCRSVFEIALEIFVVSKSLKNLVAAGCKSCIVELVYVNLNTCGLCAEFLTANLVYLLICFYKLFTSSYSLPSALPGS